MLLEFHKLVGISQCCLELRSVHVILISPQ
ncbi:hypothetical protein FGIG_11761 [Fasciola gigantica]|uniref:Uncharacterized protein n=1 Tax=Fasciola gigantica TaxID=46835 RepID=A0A504XLF8_FASGI|nr:hypothetical protein FGIG_11761 [Fasciola gigantica]